MRASVLLFLVLILGLVAPEEARANGVAESELRDLVDRYSADRAALLRRYPVERSPQRVARLKRFYDDWKGRLAAEDFERSGLEGRVDYLLLRNGLENEAKILGRYEGWLSEAAPLVPFAPVILGLNDSRLAMETMDAARAGSVLDALAQQVEDTRNAVAAGLEPEATRTAAADPPRARAGRAGAGAADESDAPARPPTELEVRGGTAVREEVSRHRPHGLTT